MNKKSRPKRENAYTRNYFFFLSLTLLALGFIAFSDNFYFDVRQESNSDPGFIIHGLLMYTWFITVVIQTNHIRKLNYQAHKKFGQIGFVLAILIILSIGYLYAVGPAYSDLPFFGKANRFLYGGFIVLVLVGYIKRTQAELHKHSLIVGILLLMEPLLSRVGMNTGSDAAVVAPAIWGLLWISLIINDILRLRRIHFLTYTGLFYWLIVYAIVLLI